MPDQQAQIIDLPDDYDFKKYKSIDDYYKAFPQKRVVTPGSSPNSLITRPEMVRHDPIVPPGTKEPEAIDYAREYGGQYVKPILSVLGGMGGGASSGGLGAAAGAGLGSVTGSFLQTLSPRLFGDAPKDIPELLQGTGEDTLFNGALPYGIDKYAVKPIIGKIASKFVTRANPAVQKFAQKGAEGFVNPSPKLVNPEEFNIQQAVSSLPQSNPVSPNPLGGSAIGDAQSGAPYNKVADKVMSDVSEVQKWKAATGEPNTVEQIALNRVTKGGINPADGSIDIDGMAKELNGPKSEVYNEAIRPEVRSNLDNFISTVQSFKQKPPTDGVMRYFKHRLMFELPVAAAGGHALGGEVGMGVASTIVLGKEGFNKLMSSGTAGRLAIESLTTPSSSAAAPFFRKYLGNMLRGTDVMIQGSDNKYTPGTVNDQGEVVPKNQPRARVVDLPD